MVDVRVDGGQAGASAPLGEVIETSTSDFWAQATTLDEAPPLGLFVRVSGGDGLDVLGVVANVETGGIETSARPIMRGHGDVRDARIYEENPDLPHVLRTTFRVLVVGFLADGRWQQFLPPRPPRLHYSVHAASTEQVRGFTDAGLGYLGTLLAAADVPADELIAANVRRAGEDRSEPELFARRAGRELAQQLRADYVRLGAILRRMLPASAGAAVR